MKVQPECLWLLQARTSTDCKRLSYENLDESLWDVSDHSKSIGDAFNSTLKGTVQLKIEKGLESEWESRACEHEQQHAAEN